jgi:hypothetical protein
MVSVASNAPSARALCLALAALLAMSAPLQAQSDGASRASQASLEAVVAVPSAALDVLAAGGMLSVVALRPVGESVEVVLQAGSDGVEFSLEVGADVAHALGLAVGTAVSATVVGAGYLLSVGATVIAFVPCAIAEEMIHGRELRR